jgi:hypothetical protein
VKLIILSFATMLLTSLQSSISGQKLAVVYDTLALHTNRGFPVSFFTTIRDKDSLNEYFREIDYDTLLVSSMPDFDLEMVIAVVTSFFGGESGNVEYYYTIEEIIEETDSIVVDIHYDSLVYDREIQHAYSVLILTVPQSEKTVFFMVGSLSSARKPVGYAFNRLNPGLLPRSSKRLYDLKGRAMPYKKHFDNSLVIQSTPHGNKKDVFIGDKVYRMK